MKQLLSRLGKLFLKQCLVALLFSGIMVGMQLSSRAPFSSYAEALGRALRYESDLAPLETAWNTITEKLGLNL